MMKKVIALMIMVLFVGMTLGIASAEEAVKPAPAQKNAPAGYSSVRGEVTAVDAAAKGITIKSTKQEVQLTVTDKTKIMVGKESKTLADVKVGDRAMANYKKEGDKNIATSIRVMPKQVQNAPASQPSAPQPSQPAKK